MKDIQATQNESKKKENSIGFWSESKNKSSFFVNQNGERILEDDPQAGEVTGAESTNNNKILLSHNITSNRK